jgi:hypothetical protein
MSNRPIRRFADMLGLLNRGKFVEKCDEHLAEALTTLEALPGEKGTATLDVKITITFESGRLDIKPSVKSKLPEEKAFSGTPFWAVDGALSVQHPSQTDMFIRDTDQRERDFA